MDRATLEGTLLGSTAVVGYNNNKNFRVVASRRPGRPASTGEDLRFNPEEHFWKLEDLAMELRSARRLGDCSTWTETPLTAFETAISDFAEFERELPKGNCIRRRDDCYLASWADEPLYRAGTFQAFSEAVENFLKFEAAATNLI